MYENELSSRIEKQLAEIEAEKLHHTQVQEKQAEQARRELESKKSIQPEIAELVRYDINALHGLLVKHDISPSFEVRSFELKPKFGIGHLVGLSYRRHSVTHFMWPIYIEKYLAGSRMNHYEHEYKMWKYNGTVLDSEGDLWQVKGSREQGPSEELHITHSYLEGPTEDFHLAPIKSIKPFIAPEEQPLMTIWQERLLKTGVELLQK